MRRDFLVTPEDIADGFAAYDDAIEDVLALKTEYADVHDTIFDSQLSFVDARDESEALEDMRQMDLAKIYSRVTYIQDRLRGASQKAISAGTREYLEARLQDKTDTVKALARASIYQSLTRGDIEADIEDIARMLPAAEESVQKRLAGGAKDSTTMHKATPLVYKEDAEGRHWFNPDDPHVFLRDGRLSSDEVTFTRKVQPDVCEFDAETGAWSILPYKEVSRQATLSSGEAVWVIDRVPDPKGSREVIPADSVYKRVIVDKSGQPLRIEHFIPADRTSLFAGSVLTAIPHNDSIENEVAIQATGAELPNIVSTFDLQQGNPVPLSVAKRQ